MEADRLMMQANATYVKASTTWKSAANTEVRDQHWHLVAVRFQNLTIYLDRYIQLLKSNNNKGYRGQQQNYIPGVDGPSGGPEIHTDYPSVQQAKGSKGSDYRPGNTSGQGGSTLY